MQTYWLVRIGVIASLLLVVGLVAIKWPMAMSLPFSATEEGFDAPAEELTGASITLGQGGWYTIGELANYTRPEGPMRVGIQIGHLDNDQVPEELSGLTANGDGATWGPYTERELMEQIGAKVAAGLEARGIVVDVLPATVPPKYQADAFISLHADGNTSNRPRGFKIAGPRRDFSGLSAQLVESLRSSYAAATALPEDDQITGRMTGYYAFNWPRYEYAIHPYTPAAIVETGFLTNAADRAFLLNEQDRVAAGVVNGVLDFLVTERVPNPPVGTLMVPTLPLTGEVVCAPLRADRRGTTTPPCMASIRDDSGAYYLLESNPPYATSSLPVTATVTGTYVPAATLPNYFWFPYEIRGIIRL